MNDSVSAFEEKETALFEQWRVASQTRFPNDYIDARIEREQRKSQGIKNPQPPKRLLSRIDLRKLVTRALNVSGLMGVGRKNASNIRVHYRNIVLKQLPTAFNGYRILHISDTHFNGNALTTNNLINAVRSAEYDLCVLTGDYRFRSFGSNALAYEGLSELMSVVKTDTLAVLGNHDSLRLVAAMESLGINVLLNERHEIRKNEQRITLVGVDDPSYYRMHDIKSACGNALFNNNECAVLLAHSPHLYEEASALGFAAYLCGHTHGGQICLPGGIPIRTNVNKPRWCVSGDWRFDALQGYTSVGAGTSIVEARFFCQPEIVVHTLQAQ